jgi:VanZ family protein
MNGRVRMFLWYQLPPILWAGIIFVLSSIPSVRLPRIGWLSSDKVVHFFVFFFLAALTYRAIDHQGRYPWLTQRHFLFTVLFTSLYGAIDEFHQFFIPGRESDPFDWIADAMGAVALIIVIQIWNMVKRRMKEREGQKSAVSG